jgi:uracil-DNA glycosylase
MPQDLPRGELPDVVGADDDRVLEVRDRSPAVRARGGPGGHDEGDRARPEDEELHEVGPREIRQPRARQEEPHADRDEVEDAGQVVHRRVVGPLLVPVVEPVELRADDPDGKRGEEEQRLEAARERPRCLGRGGGDRLRDEERGEQPDDVRREEGAANEPAAVPPEPTPTLLEEPKRALARTCERPVRGGRGDRLGGPWIRVHASLLARPLLAFPLRPSRLERAARGLRRAHSDRRRLTLTPDTDNRDFRPRPARLLHRTLGGLQRANAVCRACAEAGYPLESLPVFEGREGQRAYILGQAPGIVEGEERRPWRGRAGRTLRAWLGLDEDAFYATFYCASVTRCYPGKAPTGRGDRRPTPTEIALCSAWRERELRLLRPELVLPVGGLAVAELLGRVSVSEAVGRTFAYGQATAIPLPHPSGASGWLNVPANRDRLASALELVRDHLSRL